MSERKIEWRELWRIGLGFAQVGLPPAISDEDAFRSWLKRFGEVLLQLAKLTPTAVDDRIVSLAVAVTSDDDVWPEWYALFKSLDPQSDGTDSEETLVKAIKENPVPFTAAAGAIDPIAIVTLIQAILELIRQFRK